MLQPSNQTVNFYSRAFLSPTISTRMTVYMSSPPPSLFQIFMACSVINCRIPSLREYHYHKWVASFESALLNFVRCVSQTSPRLCIVVRSCSYLLIANSLTELLLAVGRKTDSALSKQSLCVLCLMPSLLWNMNVLFVLFAPHSLYKDLTHTYTHIFSRTCTHTQGKITALKCTYVQW